MADIMRLQGLVAADVRRTPTPGAEAAGRARPAAPPETPAATPAAEIELGPARDAAREIPAAAVRARQEAVTRLDVRADALEELRGRLAGARQGDAAQLAEAGRRARELGDRLAPGPELAKLLAQVDPQAAAAVNPAMLQAAENETAQGAAAARAQAAVERRGVAADLVAAENSAAARVETERVDRAAEMLRRAAPAGGGPGELVAALRDTSVSRGRALELLTGNLR